jgi:hypothetical protein
LGVFSNSCSEPKEPSSFYRQSVQTDSVQTDVDAELAKKGLDKTTGDQRPKL